MTISNFHRWKSVFLSTVLLFAVAPLESRTPEKAYEIVITNPPLPWLHALDYPHLSGAADAMARVGP